MSSSHIVHLATFARGRMQQEIGDGNAEIEAELQVSNPRFVVVNMELTSRRHVRPGRYAISGWRESSTPETAIET
jgi:hypothetical protein